MSQPIQTCDSTSVNTNLPTNFQICHSIICQRIFLVEVDSFHLYKSCPNRQVVYASAVSAFYFGSCSVAFSP